MSHIGYIPAHFGHFVHYVSDFMPTLAGLAGCDKFQSVGSFDTSTDGKAMSDEGEMDIEVSLPEPVILSDDTCWISDPDLLHPEAEAEGVLAVLYRAGCLWYFDGATRQWLNVEDKGPKKARLSPVRN
jgi:hypothetical protein